MHFRKALIVKMSNLRPLHHKQTIDLFKREGFENKQNDALQNGEPFQKKVFTCFAKEQLHFIAKLPLTLQINSKVFYDFETCLPFSSSSFEINFSIRLKLPYC